MEQYSIRHLLRRLPIQPGESVVSLLQRHCEANYVTRMHDMLRLVERLTAEPLRDVRDVVQNPKALHAVERLTGLTSGSLNGHLQSPIAVTHIRVGHHHWLRGLRRSESQAVCPTCLGETGYAQTGWEFTQAPVCLVHGIALLEACPSCTKPLRHRRTKLLSCGECGFPLVDGPQVSISDRAQQIAAIVQRPTMVPMGDQHSTAPIDQHDLSCLLRLCTPGGLGRGTLAGLTGPAARLTLSQRISALDRLGSTWVDRRIDSTRLRAVVVERWVAGGLLSPAVQLNLLKLAAACVELPGDVRRLLCQGNDERLELSAAKRFGGRPLRLVSLADVARYLGIDTGALATLRRSHVLDPAFEDYGHDMDQVLTLKQALDELVPLQQVDAVLGLQGLALELLTLGILKGLRLADGSVYGVDLVSLDQFLSDIQERVSSVPTVADDALPLTYALAHKTETGRMAWIVSQIRGGSLAAFSWPAPHRLIDLIVDGSRLQVLMRESWA